MRGFLTLQRNSSDFLQPDLLPLAGLFAHSLGSFFHILFMVLQLVISLSQQHVNCKANPCDNNLHDASCNLRICEKTESKTYLYLDLQHLRVCRAFAEGAQILH